VAARCNTVPDADGNLVPVRGRSPVIGLGDLPRIGGRIGSSRSADSSSIPIISRSPESGNDIADSLRIAGGMAAPSPR